MKTNLSNLMNIVVEEKRKFSSYSYSLKEYVYNTSTQKLDGMVNIIEEYNMKG